MTLWLSDFTDFLILLSSNWRLIFINYNRKNDSYDLITIQLLQLFFYNIIKSNLEINSSIVVIDRAKFN